MGFEEDYEQKLRDKKWRKPAKAFVEGKTPDIVGALIEKTLCKIVRDVMGPSGELNSLLKIARSYRDAQQQATLSLALRLPIEGANRQDIVAHLQAACDEVLHQEEHSASAKWFATLALNNLSTVFDNNTNLGLDASDAECNLIVEFLRYLSIANLMAAMRLAGRKRKELPKEVVSRMEQALREAKLHKIAENLLAGKKARASRTPRMTGKQLASMQINVTLDANTEK